HYEPLVVYLALTCFDRLGQPATWRDFPSWLSGTEPSVSEMNLASADPIESARELYKQWSARYGVRNAFYRFLDEILAPPKLRDLLASFEISILKNPPHMGTRRLADETEKKAWLYRIRNRYTHGALYMGGAHPDHFASRSPERTHLRLDQVFGAEEWE